MSTEKEEKTIDDFDGWDSSSDEINFFGEVEETEKEQPTDEDKKEGDNKKPEKEDRVENIDLFSETDEISKKEDIEEEEVEEPKEKSRIEKVSSKANLEFLKEKGIVEFELEEGQELTDDLAEEILEDSYEDAIESRLEESMENLPDVVKNIVKFAAKGGDVASFISNMVKSSPVGINKDLDLETEENQKLVIKTKLKEDGYDDEYIESNIEFLKDSGKLESTSKKFFPDIVSRQDKMAEAEAKQAQKAQAEAKERKRKYKGELSQYLGEVKDLDGITISRRDKTELPSYISDNSVKLEGGGTVSQMQKDLYDALQDKNKVLKLAKILRDDFDFSSIKKSEKSKVTKEIKKKLEHTKDLTPKAKTTRRKKLLADFL